METKKPRRKKVESVFGENLKTIMVQRQLSHKQVAEMADVRVSVVNDWVGRDGAIPHDLARVSRLAKRLGVSFEWLLTGQHPNRADISIHDLFEETSGEALSGLWKIQATKLTPRKK